jgi:capsular polysaccharide biosynthesis protein
MQIFPSHYIDYSVPDNFSEQDRKLFYDVNFQNVIEPIELITLINATVCNNLVFSKTKLYHELTQHKKPSKKIYFKSLVKKWINPKETIKESCLGIQDWSANYFHWMTETLPSLIALDGVKNKMTIPVLLISSSIRHKHISETLQLLGYTVYYYDIHKSIKISKLHSIKIPVVGSYNEPFLLNMRNAFFHKLNLMEQIKPFRKIYISRRKATRRKIVNQDDLSILLSSYDFETVFLEDYTIEHQIKLLYETQCVIAPHGAGLTNILFMQPETKVIELKAYNNDYWCFFSMARLAKLRYSYLLCESDRENHRDADITIDLLKLKNLIITYNIN